MQLQRLLLQFHVAYHIKPGYALFYIRTTICSSIWQYEDPGKLDGTYQSLVYADDVTLLDKNIKTRIKTLLNTSKKVGLHVEAKNTVHSEQGGNGSNSA
jgi:hypothetical protein